MKEAIERLISPHPLERPLTGIIVTCIAIVLTSALVRFQSYVIHKTKSIAILADSTHYKADLYLNLGVLFSIGTYILFQWQYVDILFGTGIALYIMFTAYTIIVSAFKVLLDSELPLPDRQKILDVIEAHPEVGKCCHLRTRTSGQEEFIQGHLIMKKEVSVEQAHQIAKEIKKELLSLYPHAECLFQVLPHTHQKDFHENCCD